MTRVCLVATISVAASCATSVTHSNDAAKEAALEVPPPALAVDRLLRAIKTSDLDTFKQSFSGRVREIHSRNGWSQTLDYWRHPELGLRLIGVECDAECEAALHGWSERLPVDQLVYQFEDPEVLVFLPRRLLHTMPASYRFNEGVDTGDTVLILKVPVIHEAGNWFVDER
ncbi:MAG: hypothetical protein A2289_23850 [Deltaproteobacteria bacterium RIFOXYA12_FULL_58_15]|nr:MAG: hypothetical protein A2289_23850 [Deltaproteobacteria bacterium RIFOXYA12_FULL_58_15]OGR07975.1 MAG: hypothetical protein A2341_19750 [Deltaproteobacteria bacterium RIFOXYB12_FULL_58_9]